MWFNRLLLRLTSFANSLSSLGFLFCFVSFLTVSVLFFPSKLALCEGYLYAEGLLMCVLEKKTKTKNKTKHKTFKELKETGLGKRK